VEFREFRRVRSVLFAKKTELQSEATSVFLTREGRVRVTVKDKYVQFTCPQCVQIHYNMCSDISSDVCASLMNIYVLRLSL
jgi:predicted RNA-binding Zn-ribbon protein involved in translation (DUF1610 family)